ncbi:MAG: gliding motility-associated C-terminal domain-containing protein, partial [Paludibacteraceae bacterium]|nr:gliding motility-associated C-terminal domain-containing protein [Paludibacteraceae bacterium]
AKNVNSNKLAVLLSDTTTLYLYGRDLNGCANETELTLNPLPRKHISFAIEPKWIEPSNPTVTMKGVTPSDAVWYWTPGDGSREQVGRLFHYRYDVDRLEDSVEVSVRAIDTIGCTYTGSEYLYVWKDFWAPTGFTPNNDEKNETFHFYGGKYITDFHFYIFNRQGDIVFEGNSFDAEWDGTFNGKDCPWGVYGWVANYNSDVRGTNFSGERKGMVTIVR